MELEKMIEERKVKQTQRRYLGASQIGKECPRQVWYQFRNYKEKAITPRLERLFGRGHREEPIIIADLKRIGIDVVATQEEATFADGHGGGHHDGRLKNVPGVEGDCLFEAKTMNDKNFNLLKKKGVKVSHNIYVVQIQIYMALFGFQKALLVVSNKNTDERHYEFITYDEDFADYHLSKAVDIIFARTPPKRIREQSTYYICRWCDYSDICHGDEQPLKGCRSCSKSEPIKKGKWMCKAKNKNRSFKKQLKGCGRWDGINE